MPHYSNFTMNDFGTEGDPYFVTETYGSPDTFRTPAGYSFMFRCPHSMQMTDRGTLITIPYDFPLSVETLMSNLHTTARTQLIPPIANDRPPNDPAEDELNESDAEPPTGDNDSDETVTLPAELHDRLQLTEPEHMDGPPEPKTAEEMTFKLDCKVCYEQVADTVILPCGHMVMCRWCAERLCADRDERRKVCPLCRGKVLRATSVYFG